MSSGTFESGGDDRRALQVAIEMARREVPRRGFAERLASTLEYRAELARELAPRQSWWRRAGGLGTSSIFLAAAALAVWLGVKPSLPSIEAEANAPLPRAPAPAGPSSAHPAARAVPATDPCGVTRVANGTALLIDDFEDGDDSVAPFEGRSGLWRWARETDNPGTAPALLPIPRPGGTRKNRLALHVKGSLLVDWGATAEFTFNPGCYDASKYRGVSFDARGPGRIYFAPREARVIPIEEGGTCEKECHNPHVAKLDLSEDWQSYLVLWEEVRQRGAEKPALDPTRLRSLAFLIRPEDTPYDVWLDDVRFVP